MKLLKVMSILCISILILKCEDDIKTPPCDNTTSDFKDIYQDRLTAGFIDDVSMDTSVHEYTFTLSADKEVCEIGYQSQPGIASLPYTIEIINNATNVLEYSGSHVFSATATSYVTPTTTINLQSGVSYTVKRIQTNVGTSFGNIIGRFASGSPTNFPYTSGIMTITDNGFYQLGEVDNQFEAIPYIDLILR